MVFLSRTLAVLAVLIWFFPSDVLELVARQRPVLLGRYSVERFTLYLALTALLIQLALLLSRSWRSRKSLLFGMITPWLLLLLVLTVTDLALRWLVTPRYRQERLSRRSDWPSARVGIDLRTRPPNHRYEVTYSDRPKTHRSYPITPAGYPTVQADLSTDARGYRNRRALERADILAIGDSFTEGSRVCDEQTWPVLISDRLKTTVYVAGTSGASLSDYLLTLQTLGPSLEPRLVLLMFCEGNDFSGRSRGSWSGLKRGSPLIARLKVGMIRLLGPLRASTELDDDGLFSWMPITLETGERPHSYAFRSGHLARLYQEPVEFSHSSVWQETSRLLREIVREVGAQKSRLVLIYAPNKPHVVLPLVKDQLPAEPLRKFVAYREKGLPSAALFKELLFEYLDTKEEAIGDFCKEHDVEFLSTTRSLRQRMEIGEQIHYTYDQHWTALGHAAVADLLANYLNRTMADGI